MGINLEKFFKKNFPERECHNKGNGKSFNHTICEQSPSLVSTPLWTQADSPSCPTSTYKMSPNLSKKILVYS